MGQISSPSGGISEAEVQQRINAAVAAAVASTTKNVQRSSLPNTLYCEAYHGGTMDTGWGHAVITVTPSYAGTVVCSCTLDTRSGTGGAATLVINESTQVAQGNSTTISFSAGQTIRFRMVIDELQQWGKAMGHASFSWSFY
jgi:hypothetical protein